jgi:hypothetical protein
MKLNLNDALSAIKNLSKLATFAVIVLIVIAIFGAFNTCNGQISFTDGNGYTSNRFVFLTADLPEYDPCLCDTLKIADSFKMKDVPFLNPDRVRVSEHDTDAESVTITYEKEFPYLGKMLGEGWYLSTSNDPVTEIHTSRIALKLCNGKWVTTEGKAIPPIYANPTQRTGNVVHRGVFANGLGIWQIVKPDIGPITGTQIENSNIIGPKQ